MAFSDINPVQHKQLFLDDDAIASMERVKRTLHQPEKQGPVIKPDHSQEQVSLQSRSAPQWNPEKDFWEWWYWGNYTVPPHGPHHSTMMRVNLYATSTDGLHWERPSLRRYEWRGTTVSNNIAHDPNAKMLYHIIRDASEENPQCRYKALFDTSDRALGVSPDGFDWTMLDVPPIPSQDESHFIYDELTGQYLAFVKHGTEWGRSVWLSTSTDFVHFTEPELIFHSDELDQEHRRQRIEKVVQSPTHLSPPLVDDTDHLAQVYQMAVMPYEGIYIGFPVLFNPAGAIPPPQRNFTGLNQVELTVSRDLQNWERVADRALFIEVDEWDGINYGTAQNLLCGRPIVHEEREILFYYNALRFRGHKELHPAEYAEFFNDIGALCLAKLRLDGFVSLDADTEGTVTTKPFMLAGENLIVNADATNGELRAEILDAETLTPLSGLSAEACIPLHGDHLHGHIRWGAPPKLVSEKPVCIRFILKQAKLYAFWLMVGESDRS